MIDTWANVPTHSYPKTGLDMDAFKGLVAELKQPENFAKYDKPAEAILQEIFDMVNTDNRGHLTEVELSTAIRKATGSLPDAAILTLLYDKHARNADGTPTMDNDKPAFSFAAFKAMHKDIKSGKAFRMDYKYVNQNVVPLTGQLTERSLFVFCPLAQFLPPTCCTLCSLLDRRSPTK